MLLLRTPLVTAQSHIAQLLLIIGQTEGLGRDRLFVSASLAPLHLRCCAQEKIKLNAWMKFFSARKDPDDPLTPSDKVYAYANELQMAAPISSNALSGCRFSSKFAAPKGMDQLRQSCVTRCCMSTEIRQEGLGLRGRFHEG